MTTPTGHFSQLSETIFTELEESYKDFGGRELTAAAVDNIEPFMNMEELANGTLILKSGLDATILRSLGHALNFT